MNAQTLTPAQQIARKDAAEAMTQARTGLVLYAPFFGTLALRLKMQPEEEIPTAAVDGRTLWYNPEFTNGLSHDQRRGLIAHEVMHCALNHHTRRHEREPRKWNVAADHAINLSLLDSGFVLPDNGCADPQFKNMSAEAIYSQLPALPPGGGSSGQGDDPGGCGAVMDATDDQGNPAGEADRALQESDWKVATIEAAQVARAQGKLPGAFAGIIEEYESPRVDWRVVLRNFVEATARNDYSWSRPNRRFIGQGLYLPSLYNQELGHLILAADTSASTRRALPTFGGNMRAMIEELQPARVTVIYCDSKVQRVEEYEGGDVFRMRGDGQGGTRFKPVFRHIEKMGEQPACLVYLTDMCVGPNDWPDDPGYPVLWAAVGTDAKAPIGETVRIDA